MADDTAPTDPDGAAEDRRDGRGSTSASDHPHVLVSAGDLLVGESVRRALTARGLVVRGVDWPAEQELRPDPTLRQDRWRVGLALTDLRSEDDLTRLGRLVQHVRVRWLLLTHSPRGPLWGAALERGVAALSPSSTTVDELVGLIDRAATGAALLDQAEATELVAAWHEVRGGRAEALRGRVRSLSPRETQVLEMLYGGRTVVEISADLEMSQPTVRSHVRAVLRKLGVNSQLSAVARYAESLAGPVPPARPQ